MQIERKGDAVVITVPCTEASLKGAAPSSSGKTLIVDTGNGKFPMGPHGNLTIQVSAYIPNPAFVKAPVAAKGALKSA